MGRINAKLQAISVYLHLFHSDVETMCGETKTGAMEIFFFFFPPLV